MAVTWTATMWYDDVEPVTHATLGLARMLWQYRDKPRMQGFLTAFLNDCQSLEDVTLQVLTGRWPLTAIGVQLDVLGRIVGQERGELTDDQYRLYILARILVNKGNGRVEEIIDILEILGVTEAIYVDEGTAELRVDISGQADGNLIGDLVNDARGGGIRLDWRWNEQTESACFAMGDTLGADETNATGGFGDLTGATQTTGGYFSGSTTS